MPTKNKKEACHTRKEKERRNTFRSYAICICTYYEHLLHEKLKQFEHNGEIYDCTPITKGMRYIDDLLVFLAWNKSDAKTIDLADAIIK